MIPEPEQLGSTDSKIAKIQVQAESPEVPGRLIRYRRDKRLGTASAQCRLQASSGAATRQQGRQLTRLRLQIRHVRRQRGKMISHHSHDAGSGLVRCAGFNP